LVLFIKEGQLSRRLKRSNARANDERNFFTNLNADTRDNVLSINQYRKHKQPKKVVLLPKNLSQESYIDALENPNINIVFAIGYAGTGKTYLATLYAIQQLKSGAVDKIVITRPNIAVDDKDIGFLPGDIMKKMAPWTKPVLDVFEEYFSVKEITAMIEENVIELVPLAYIRGRTFKNAIVILDEAQNTTRNSMLSALTRIGENSKVIVTGDTKQSDRGNSNGLTDFLGRFESSNHIEVCKFGYKDVERHPVITEILKMYGEE
jgi:phosphate starvation-inducible PhoH-like protein